MKKNLLLIIFCLIGIQTFSQLRTVNGGFAAPKTGEGLTDRRVDSLNGEIDVLLSGKTKYTDFKIISHKNDTTIVDTTLTLKKHYKFNFLRKDNFELLAFHNQGQTFNNLGYNFGKTSVIPDIGFKAKQFNYFNIEDVDYYHVPTPTTEIMYRTGLEQGQVLDALFTVNFSKRLNIGIAYRGLRSLGAYRRSLASTGNFRFTFSYESPEGQYAIRGHAVNQDFTNQENGGLTDTALTAFLTDDVNFSSDRGRLDVNLNDAESVLEGKRLYFEQTYKILSSKDTVNDKDFSNLKVGHSFTRDSKFFEFKQTTASDFFDFNRISGSIANKTNYLVYDNQLFVDFNSKYVLGKFRVRSGYTTYNYGYENLQNNLVAIENNRLKGDAVSFGADWRGKVKNFYINASGTLIPGSGRLSGNDLLAEAFYKKDSVFSVKAKLRINSKRPDFNFLLHQSNYNKFNWENNFSNIGTRVLGGEFNSKWGNASLDITNIDNYTYFDEDGSPAQYGSNINYLKAKVSKEFKFWKFGFDNTLMYQKVASGSDVLRVPEFVTRNTLYYMDNWFKGNPLLVQIGATFKYFSEYKANAYNPLLGDFMIQNNTEIGYPTVDFFFNARVRRTRIYFKADNLSSFFLKKDYLSAPNHPYRDFVIRFGVVWNWFI
ncbi:Putative porin [Tenacibaculum sp. MAR_2009_124]|uniref:putative porin n=1 Tax=Tenacibaculum sp. MAR_2009_124 TaxID=1250059 RepID=UPI00089940F0|nr:putative porin [Tenacibaculum sp. MAR_2009_124]SEC20047.1 Putative porin [Tenacibaculum sp. MAR_2009_124]